MPPPTLLTARFSEALAWAVELHAEQPRKGSRAPYVSHLLRVAGIALEYGADEDEAIAAVLHDAVEDQGGETTRIEIERRFGPHVAEIVDGCTDTDQSPKPDWRHRKERHITRLRAASPSVRLVVSCDKIDNARSILDDLMSHGATVWDRFRGGRPGVLWYYGAVTDALQRADEPGSPHDRLHRLLRRTVDGLVEAARQFPTNAQGG